MFGIAYVSNVMGLGFVMGLRVCHGLEGFVMGFFVCHCLNFVMGIFCHGFVRGFPKGLMGLENVIGFCHV